MKHRRVKNLIIAVLVSVIYQSYIVPAVPAISEIFGCFAACLIVMLLLEYWDCSKKAKRDARRKMHQEMTKSA